MTTRRVIPAVMALLTVGALLAAAGAARAALPPRYDFLLRVSPEGGISTLDPCRARTLAERDMVGQLFEGLVRSGDAGAEPVVATTWSVSADSLAWTFHLDPGRAFGDGTPLRASHVLAAWQRAAHEAPEWAWLFDGLGAEAPDSLTVRLRLTKRTADLLDRLALPAAFITREITAGGNRSLSGSGPFRFAGRGDDGFVLAPRLDDPRGRPFAGRILVRPVDTAAALQALWRRGGTAIAHGAALGDRVPDGVVTPRSTPTAWLLLVNPRHPALESRSARSLAVRGVPSSTESFKLERLEAAPSLETLWDERVPASADWRRRVAGDRSETPGPNPAPLSIVIDGGDPVSVALADDLIDGLRPAGFAATPTPMGTTPFRQALRTGDFDLLILRWDSPAARAALALPELMARPEIARLAPEGMTLPADARGRLTLLTDQLCLLPLVRRTPTVVSRSDLTGMALDPLTGAVRLSDVWPMPDKGP